MSCREEHCHQGAVAAADEHGLVGAYGVEDGDHIVDLFLECRKCHGPVREPSAAPVEVDQTADRGEPFERAAGRRVLPDDFEVREWAPDEQDVSRSLAD